MSLSEQSHQHPHESEAHSQRGHQDTTSANNRLVLQIRAFLEASEEVDIDAETLEDLIAGISQDAESGDVSDDDDDFNTEERHLDSDAAEEEIDVSALYSIEDEGIDRNLFQAPESHQSIILSSPRNLD